MIFRYDCLRRKPPNPTNNNQNFQEFTKVEPFKMKERILILDLVDFRSRKNTGIKNILSNDKRFNLPKRQNEPK